MGRAPHHRELLFNPCTRVLEAWAPATQLFRSAPAPACVVVLTFTRYRTPKQNQMSHKRTFSSQSGTMR
eukprot:3150637-Pyramimonas_sp.AAC.2